MQIDANGLRTGLEPRSIPAGPVSIAALFDGLDESDATILIDRSGELSYRDFIARVHAAAVGLRSLGMGAGDMVGASSANAIDLVVAFFAVQRLGAIWVGINRPLAAPEKVVQLADCGARFFLGDANAIAQIEQERASMPELRTVLSMIGPDTDLARLIDAHSGQRLDVPLPDPMAPAVIGYTSGTTGIPKGVVHNQRSFMVYLNACFHSDEGGQWVRGARRTLPIPITNPNGMVYGPLAAITGGGSFVAMDRSDAEGVGEWVDRCQIEVANFTPTTMRDLVFKPELQRFSLKSLKAVAVGGSAPSEDLHTAFRARFGYEMIADYGQTESPSSMASTLAHAIAPAGATGKAHPHVQLAIMDPEGNRLPPGAEGELCAAAPDEGPWADVYTAMLGYWRKPDLTRAAFHDNKWLRTGDMGFIDAAGYLTLVGRKKELILRGGANIYPAEIEHVLRTHPKINDAVVVGLPDDRLGEIVGAYVQLEPDVARTAELAGELRAYCLSQIARYKAPERWFVIDEIPRNAMNKPMRNLLGGVPLVELTPA